MKKMFIVATVLATSLGVISCTPEKSKVTKLESEMDSVSYAIGVSNGMQLKTIPGNDTINVDVLNAGFETSYTNDTANLLLTEEEVQTVLSNYFRKLQIAAQEEQVAKNKEIAAKNKVIGDSILRKNSVQDGVRVTESGLQYRVITKGNGPTPKVDDVVRVNYVGKFLDGNVFDASERHGGPAEFAVNRVIKGWTEVLQLMPVGSKYEVWIPSDLAYGDEGSMGIEPGSSLYFEVELLSIVSNKK